MEPKGPLPYSQQLAILPCSEQDQYSPCPLPTSCRSILIFSSHLYLGLPSSLFPSGFLTKILYAPLLAPIYSMCPAHLSIGDLITRIIFGEEYRSLSSSLLSFLQFPVTLYRLGQNILLGVLYSYTLCLHPPST